MYDSSGKYIRSWGSPDWYPDLEGVENYPLFIAVDSSGNVYVADTQFSIQKFDSSGKFVTKWGSYGSGNGQLSYPIDIAVDSSANVYVADRENYIQKFDRNGKFITKWGSDGSSDGQFKFLNECGCRSFWQCLCY